MSNLSADIATGRPPQTPNRMTAPIAPATGDDPASITVAEVNSAMRTPQRLSLQTSTAEAISSGDKSGLSLQDAITRVQEVSLPLQRDLQFRVDEDSGRTIVTVIDSETEEVIRQVPSEELLRLAEHMDTGELHLFAGKV